MAFESLQPLEFATATGRIADQIRASIIDGTLAAGTQLTETLIANRLAVSRGPVREAMQRLIQEGLLRAEPHRGVFVIELGHDDIADIYFARASIERAAAIAMLQRDTAEVLAALEAEVQRMELAAAAGEWRAVVDADLAFHELLVSAARSKRLTRMFRTLSAETRMCIAGLRSSYRDWGDLVAEHRALLGAFDRGAQSEIVTLLDQHLYARSYATRWTPADVVAQARERQPARPA